MVGCEWRQLASSVGDSIPGSIANTVYLKIASRVTGRAVACGYSREKPETPKVWHVYPEGGIGVLCQKLAEGIEDRIELNSPVQEILVENEEVVGVKVGGEDSSGGSGRKYGTGTHSVKTCKGNRQTRVFVEIQIPADDFCEHEI